MSAAAIKIPLNIGLAFQLAKRSLKHRKMIALATLLGVAIGVGVVNAVLIVDANTARGYEAEAVAEQEATGTEQAADGTADGAARQKVGSTSFAIRIERVRDGQVQKSIVPTQRGSAGRIKATNTASSRPGEEDYQAMRLAVRMASLLAFFIGAVIVFYTMRYSVSTRAREFSLMLCLGESRRNVGASLMAEASLLGALGTIVGLIVAFPAAAALLGAGVSTNGRRPLPGFEIPWFELSGMGLISLVIVYLGVASPLREIHRLSIPDVLQPRFLSTGERDVQMAQRGFGWLIPPMLAAGWIGMRPFMEDWLSVVYFFLFEAAFVGLLAVATLWWLSPFLRGTIRIFETLFRVVMPLETFLTGRRMRLNSKRLVFSVTGVTLVFSLLTGLHDVTRALKDEVSIWAWQAMGASSYLERPAGRDINENQLQAKLATNGIALMRMSAKAGGVFPARLIRGDDVNPLLRAQGHPTLDPGKVILSRTLAARYDTRPGDAVLFSDGKKDHRFVVIGISDNVGFYLESAQYVDLKSYALFSDGNPIFADNLEKSLGRYASARPFGSTQPYLYRYQEDALYPWYVTVKRGRFQAYWQSREIDRDFLIFDFILLGTVILAGIGVANTMLIQVRARDREFAVLKSIGISRGQVARMLLIEGTIIGCVSAALAIIIGNGLGAISIRFLDHFTLFDYFLRISLPATLYISALCIGTCVIASIYPAFIANRASSAESLHYE
ncbi:MAG: putative ABC transport system permease protein [Paracoccaceae bacterium]|jgi:putative ABC transport system permease protein